MTINMKKQGGGEIYHWLTPMPWKKSISAMPTPFNFYVSSKDAESKKQWESNEKETQDY